LGLRSCSRAAERAAQTDAAQLRTEFAMLHAAVLAPAALALPPPPQLLVAPVLAAAASLALARLVTLRQSRQQELLQTTVCMCNRSVDKTRGCIMHRACQLRHLKCCVLDGARVWQ